MFVQVQVMLDESNKFKLVARLHTENETGLVHQQVVELDESLNKSFIRLLHPNMMEFKDVTATASSELIAKALAEQAEKEAAKANEIQEGEVTPVEA